MASNHYFPLTDEQRSQMLSEIGVQSFSELLTDLSPTVSCPDLKLPPALSEFEVMQMLTGQAEKNLNGASMSTFIGAGAYEHFIPAAVDYLTSRGEFATAYTPYQAEASQGTLEAMFEFQSMICELTGLEVSNASLYDGATSLAEACLAVSSATGRKKVLIAQTVHPEYREVVSSYLKGTGIKLVELPADGSGEIDRKALEKLWSENTAGVAVQTPNFFGLVENLKGLSAWIHERGGLFIIAANPIALAYFKSAGEWGADIAVGELQPLGMPLSFGGPYAGYFTTTPALMRRVPGRICGETVDSEGASAFTLTLQAREQHIRRERASSNICTNQALCALRAAVFLSLMGMSGMRRLAELNLENAYYLREKLGAIRNVSLPHPGPIFNEFVYRTKYPAEEFLHRLRQRKIQGGVALERWYPDRPNDILACATELKDKQSLDNYVNAVAGSI